VKLFKSYRFWLGVILIAAVIGLRYSGIVNYVSLESMQEKRLQLMQFVQGHYIRSVLIFIALYALVVISALPLPALFTLTGGFLFGTIPGTLFANIGATSGAIIFFLIIRHSLGASIQARYKDQLANFNERVKKYGISYLIAIRFIAFIPFFIQNTLIGLTNVSLATFVWTTSVGILPGAFVYAYAGQQLATIDSIADVFSGYVLIAFILLALLGIVPILVQRYMDSR